MSNTELTLAPDGTLAVPLPQAMPIAELIQGVVKTGMTVESAGVVEKLAALYERMEAKAAEKQFNASFVALKAALPVIVASSVIQNRGKYERFEDICNVVDPLLSKHGFVTSYTQETDGARITVTCKLMHIGGHSQSNSFSVRTGNKADSETQADCKASTTAKRNALIQCLNLVIRQNELDDDNDDASLEGAPITADKVQYLRELVKETASDEKAFLAFVQADSFENIRESYYERGVSALHRKQQKR